MNNRGYKFKKHAFIQCIWHARSWQTLIFIFILILFVSVLLLVTELQWENTNTTHNSVLKSKINMFNRYEVKDIIDEMRHMAPIQRSMKNYTSLSYGTREDALHTTLMYNRAFVAMADLQTSTVEDANGEEHVYSRTQPTSVADQVLHDNVLYINGPQGITNTFVNTFLQELSTSQEKTKKKEEEPLVVFVKGSLTAEFVFRCLKEQAHVLLSPNGEIIKERRKFILITSCRNDCNSCSFFVNKMDKLVNIERDLLDHPLLHHWYGQNGDIVHPKFTSLPIGVDFHYISLTTSRECHQTPPEQSLQMIEPLLKDVDVKRLLPSYVHLYSINLHPRFAPGESDDDRFDFSLVDWAIIPKKTNESDHVQELKWTSFDKLDGAEQKMLSEMEVDFGIIIEGVSRNNSRHYEQYYTANNESSNVDANSNEEYLSRIALQRIDDQGTNTNKKMNRVMLYATLSEMYMYALRTTGFSHPTLRETKVLLTFDGVHCPFLRNPIKSYLQSHMNDFAVDGRVKRNKMWSMMRKYAFIASPPGIGYDCYRTWEALVLGCIPIVVHPSKFDALSEPFTYRHHRNGVAAIDVNASLELYDDLPVVIVNNFDKEVKMDSLRQWQTEIYNKNVKGEYHLYKLLNQYWLDRFLDKL